MFRRVSDGRELLRDALAKLGQSREQQYCTEHQTGAIDDQKAAHPEAPRDVGQPGQLVGIGLWCAPAPTLTDQFQYRFRCCEQERPGQHVRQPGLHRSGQIPAHQDQHHRTSDDHDESVEIANLQQQQRQQDHEEPEQAQAVPGQE
jgi:hypothetical protein